MPPLNAAYGEEAPFAIGRRLLYPDFGVEFLGKVSDLPFTYYRFEIRSETERIEVRFGVGGVLSRTEFSLEGKSYALDLVRDRASQASVLVVSEVAARE